MAKLKSQVTMRVNRDILKEFAAEISRITHYPLSQDTINRAIEAVKPRLLEEEESGEGEKETGPAVEADKE